MDRDTCRRAGLPQSASEDFRCDVPKLPTFMGGAQFHLTDKIRWEIQGGFHGGNFPAFCQVWQVGRGGSYGDGFDDAEFEIDPVTPQSGKTFSLAIASRETAGFACRFSAFLHSLDMRTTISVSGRGVISLPAELRRAAGIRPLDDLIAETTPDGILLRPAVTLPLEIYTDARVAEFDAAEADLAEALSRTKAK